VKEERLSREQAPAENTRPLTFQFIVDPCEEFILLASRPRCEETLHGQ
jgi:hypothetical protein